MAGYLKLLVLFIIIIPGVAAAQIIPDLAEADRIYPALLLELLPAGILGIVLAGFVAGLMASTDSTLHAASTIITMDFVRKAKPNLGPKTLVWVGRAIIVSIILISAIWAPMIGSFGTLFEYVQGLLSYAVAPFVVVYLGGLFWPRATSKGALAALLGGIICAVMIGLLRGHIEMLNMHYLHVPLPIALISLMIFIGVSLSGPAKEIDQALLWHKASASMSPDPTKGKDVIIALILLALIGLQVIIFW